MRTLGRALLLLLILVVVSVSAFVVLERWQAWRNLEPVRNAGLDERVLFEAIGPAMRFNAATNDGWFALQGFVVAPAEARRRVLGLTVEITLEGRRRDVLHRERRYVGLHRIDQPTPPYGLLDGRVTEPAWILATEWIDLAQWPRTRSVAVRVIQRDADVQTVLWRGAIDSRLNDAQTNLRYRRLGGAAREALTENWITPSSLIAPDVKRELVRYRLERLGPLGQPGRDFIARKVLRSEATSTARTYRTRYAAIALTPAMPVSFQLDAPSRVEIDARLASGWPMRAELIAGGGRPVRPINARWTGDLPAGLYELRSADAGTVDVRDSGSGDALVPDGLRPRFHVAGPSAALRYALYPVAGTVPDLRLSLRARTASSVAVLTFTDTQGNALASRSVAVPWVASTFDRPADALDRPASEPERVDLQPPPGARELRVASSNELLVVASTTLPARAELQVDPRRRWFSFFPSLDPRSPLSQGVVIVQQPRRTGSARATLLASSPAGTARLTPVDTPPKAAAARRPVLRLRPERGDADRDE